MAALPLFAGYAAGQRHAAKVRTALLYGSSYDASGSLWITSPLAQAPPESASGRCRCGDTRRARPRLPLSPRAAARPGGGSTGGRLLFSADVLVEGVSRRPALRPRAGPRPRRRPSGRTRSGSSILPTPSEPFVSWRPSNAPPRPTWLAPGRKQTAPPTGCAPTRSGSTRRSKPSTRPAPRSQRQKRTQPRRATRRRPPSRSPRGPGSSWLPSRPPSPISELQEPETSLRAGRRRACR